MKLGPANLPYRPCVGAMILNRDGLVWVGRRFDAPGKNKNPNPEGRGTWWQMPQGGIDDGEDPAIAVLREVKEETGMTSVEIAAALPGNHYYDLPPELIAQKMWGGRYGGQCQTWFVLRFTGDDTEVAIDTGHGGVPPEFDAWRWAPTAELPALIVPFKRKVYAAVLTDAAKLGFT
jgi:putative (di)nucleoside polyphosphate hydrolase